MELAPGAVIAERYRLDHKVGSGGMGQVWAGEHLAVGGKVAIKTLLASKAWRHDLVARFKREAQFLGRIRSDHVARVLDFIDDPATGLVLVMEFVEGEALADVLRVRRLGVEEAIEIGTDIASGLCDLHAARVVHRDLKPANIILRPLPDGRYRATIVDFGVSRSTKPIGDDEDTVTRITRSHVALGTVEYMAPEQVLNSRDASEVSDVYALGAILFRSITGRHVFGRLEGGILAQEKIRAEAPPLKTGRTDRLALGLEEVVSRAVRRRPAQRFGSAREMLEALSPLRDLVRVAALHIESLSTTQEGRRLVAAEMAALELSDQEPIAEEAASDSETPDAAQTAAARRSEAPPRQPELPEPEPALAEPPRLEPEPARPEPEPPRLEPEPARPEPEPARPEPEPEREDAEATPISRPVPPPPDSSPARPVPPPPDLAPARPVAPPSLPPPAERTPTEVRWRKRPDRRKVVVFAAAAVLAVLAAAVAMGGIWDRAPAPDSTPADTVFVQAPTSPPAAPPPTASAKDRPAVAEPPPIRLDDLADVPSPAPHTAPRPSGKLPVASASAPSALPPTADASASGPRPRPPPSPRLPEEYP